MTDKKAILWCQKSNNTSYVEASAKEAINVEEAFVIIVKKCLLNDKEDEDLAIPDKIDLVTISHDEPKSSSCNC